MLTRNWSGEHQRFKSISERTAPAGYYEAPRLQPVSARCCRAVLVVQLWVSPLRFDYLHPHWLVSPAVKHINEISASLGGRITTLAGRPDWDCGERGTGENQDGARREGLRHTVFHFVASRRVMTHCVPPPSIRLLGRAHTCMYTCWPCVR